MDHHGDHIPGSGFYRAFCEGCGEPMRVSRADLGHAVWCERCDPPAPRRRKPKPSDSTETSPAWENAVRALEDGR